MMRCIHLLTTIHNTSHIILKDVPVSSCILECADGTLAMIDTGMSDNPEFVEKMAGWGYKPSDFNLLINTHLHPDHAGNNKLFCNARIILSRAEWLWQGDLEKRLQDCDDSVALLRSLGRLVDESLQPICSDLKDLAEQFPLVSRGGDRAQMEWIEDQPLLPTGWSLIPAPGHTPASYAIKIASNVPLLISGDALYHRDLWQTESLTAIHDNPAQFQKTAARLASFDGIIIPGHDNAFNNNSQAYLQDEFVFL